MKNLIMAIAVFLIALPAIGQHDILYTKKMDTMHVVNVQLTLDQVKFKKKVNPTGPTHLLNKEEVHKIVYADGSEKIITEVKTGRIEKRKEAMERGKNLIGVNLLAPAIKIDDARGMYLFYERYWPQYKISMKIPVNIEWANGFTLVSAGFGSRFYALDNGFWNITLGLEMLMGGIVNTSVDNFFYSLTLEPGVQINPLKNLFIGAEIGLGYAHAIAVSGNNTATDIGFVYRPALNIGVRF